MSVVDVALLICTLVNSFIIYETFDRQLDILKKEKTRKRSI